MIFNITIPSIVLILYAIVNTVVTAELNSSIYVLVLNYILAAHLILIGVVETIALMVPASHAIPMLLKELDFECLNNSLMHGYRYYYRLIFSLAALAVLIVSGSVFSQILTGYLAALSVFMIIWNNSLRTELKHSTMKALVTNDNDSR